MNKKDANIILMGFMGTGKTVTGKTLAAAMNRQLIDMDDEIVSREGRPIKQIFAEDGEPHFRQIERRIVQELATRTNLIIAAGGGVVLNPLNVADLNKTGFPVCLRATPATIYARIKDDTGRPLLQVPGDKIARIKKIMDERQPLYSAIPHQFDCDNRTVEELSAEIISAFKAWSQQ